VVELTCTPPSDEITIAEVDVVCFTANADAAGRHSGTILKAAPGAPGGFARPSKLDRELTTRAGRRPAATTRAIVSLQPGAQLPSEFAPYAKRFARLGIVNGALVDVPNRLLKQLAAHPSVFSVHYDRPVARFNYRTSLAVGTRPVHDLLGRPAPASRLPSSIPGSCRGTTI
jgi:hypothetical protein